MRPHLPFLILALLTLAPVPRAAANDCDMLWQVTEFIAPLVASSSADLDLQSGFKRLLKKIEDGDIEDVLSLDVDPVSGRNAYDKHVRLTAEEVKLRLKDEHVSRASRFHSPEVAREALGQLQRKIDLMFGQTANQKGRTVARVIPSRTDPHRVRLSLTYSIDKSVGFSFELQPNGSIREFSDIKHVTVVINRVELRPGMYRYEVLTAYPDSRAP